MQTKPLNYSAHVVEEIDELKSDLLANGDLESHHYLEHLSKGIEDSPKFILPSNGQIFDNASVINSIQDIAVPYHKFVLEIPLIDTYETKRLVYIECEDSVITPKTVMSIFTTLYNPDTSRWDIYPALVSLYGRIQYLEDKDIYQTKIGLSYYGEFKKIYDQVGEEDKEGTNTYFHSVSEGSFKALVHFLVYMNTSNKKTSIIKAPAALNKKRKKNNKIPLADYHVLNLNIQGYNSHSPSGKDKKGTKRFHVRRGHIRHYEKHIVYIEPMNVGNKANGIVDKDYKI